MGTDHGASETPPGPSGLPVIGNTRELAGNRLQFMTETAREYGDVARIDFVGDDALYGLFHPDHVEHVLVRNNEQYVKGDFFQNRLSLLDGGLLNSGGEAWREQRHQIEPAFGPERIVEYGRTMVAYTERRVDGWETPTVMDVHEEMMQVTLEIVADALFDVDIRAAESEIAEALETVMAQFRRKTARPVDIPDWVPTSGNREYNAARETLTGIVDDIVAESQATGDGGDVVSMLLSGEDAMDPDTVADQVLTLLLAGHETTAQSLTFTLYLLATHPDVERRVLAELDEALDGDPPTVMDLPSLPSLERVVQESMRLYPPVPAIVRQPTSDDTIGGYRVPEGVTVLLSQWVIHRDPRLYDNPRAFDPDRWERRDRSGRHGFAYFPFGGGPRRCIGDRFATMEARLVLARLLQSYRFETVPETDLSLSPAITLRPEDGLALRVRDRE